MLQKLLMVASPGVAIFLAIGAAESQEPRRELQRPTLELKSLSSLLGGKQALDPKSAAVAADVLESAYRGTRLPESVRMLVAILRGSQMGPGDGWFGPAQSRYSWKWLAERYGADPAKGGITRKNLPGPDDLFARLDRDKDGVISPVDLDWSDRNPYVQMSYMVNRLFRKLNTQANGRLTKDELLHFFDRASQGKDHISADDFRDALLAGLFGNAPSGDGPKADVLIRGLFSGELGSMSEGPKLNDLAPDFALKTTDGKRLVQLSKLIGPKPVVLVFGSFT